MANVFFLMVILPIAYLFASEVGLAAKSRAERRRAIAKAEIKEETDEAHDDFGSTSIPRAVEQGGSYRTPAFRSTSRG
jgi:hypothetical protein